MATSPKSVRLDDDLWTRLDALAQERGTSRNDLIAQACKSLLDPAPPIAHTPANLPTPADQQPAPVLNRKPPNFGPKVDTSMVPWAGDLQAQRVDRLKRSPR